MLRLIFTFIFKNRQTRQEQTLFWGGGGIHFHFQEQTNQTRTDTFLGGGVIHFHFQEQTNQTRTDTFLGGGGKRVDIRVAGCNAFAVIIYFAL